MSIKLFALIFLAVIIAIALVVGIMVLHSVFMATRGRKIAAYPDPRKALVILDIQEGYSGTNVRQPVTRPPTSGILFTVNSLIDKAAGSAMEVAYIRQVFSNNTDGKA